MRDVIVVGAGGGGPVVAKELAAHGLDVLLLEAGAHVRDPDAEWSRYENEANNPFTGYLRFGPGDRTKPAWFRELPQNSLLFQVAGVGGTTQHYAANCPRAMPGAFMGYRGADRAAYDRAHPFPFRYRELVPYYEWVEHTLPVQTAAIGTKEALFLEAAERLGLPFNRSKDISRASFRPQENAILQPGGTAGTTADSRRLLYPEARGCTFCGSCYEGCIQPRLAPRNLKAKRSTDNSYVPMALTADLWARGGRPIELRSNAFVTQVLFDQNGSRTAARGVRWRDTETGEFLEESAHVVVLAGGCTEDPRLWLNSGLPDPNGWVGRGYTNHSIDMLVGKLGRYTGNSKGTTSSARVDYPGRGMLEQFGFPPASSAAVTQISAKGMRGFSARGETASRAWDGPSGRLTGPEVKDLLADVDQLLSVIVVTDDDVEADNRVVRSSFPPDEHGPIPKVVFGRRSRRTVRNREFLARRAAGLLRAAGATQVYRIDLPPVMIHVQSTMRMGHVGSDSVLDPTGEARFVDRLFVASNAALPNAIGGPNPTLTTQALATRTAEKIFEQYFGGDPFVVDQAPVPSTDERVTKGLLDGRGAR